METKGQNGGARPGAGRKPKADEIALIERLSPMDDIALDALKMGVQSGEYNFIKLFFEYRWSKPKQDVSIDGQLNLLIPAPVVYNQVPPLSDSENKIDV